MISRRTFLSSSVTTGAMVLPSGVMACIDALCNPDTPDNLVGTDNRPPPLRPTFCLSDRALDLMTVQWKGDRWSGRWIRLSQFAWSYGLMYPNGSSEFYRVQVRNQRCWNKQRVHSGTRIILWMNCVNREDRRTWRRYWFATRPVTDSGAGYTLDLYHTEPARSYEDRPSSVPRFVQFVS